MFFCLRGGGRVSDVLIYLLTSSRFGIEASPCPASMLSKTKRPYDPNELPPARRLRHNLVDLFGRNVISGSRASELLRDAAAAGVSGCAELVGASSSNDGPHGARTLQRRLLRWTVWPDLYVAEISLWDPRRSCPIKEKVAFLLPHEIVAAVARTSHREALLSKSRLDPHTQAHLTRCETAAGAELLGVGVWGDGVPMNWDRSDSLNVFSLNFPGLPPPWHTLRVPLTGFSKRHFDGRNTYDDVLRILAWSFESLASGRWPTARHDGAVFDATDAKRKKRAGAELPLRGALVEVRGDWSFLKESFGFPAWNEGAGMCWLCRCRPEELRQVGADATWRRERLSLHDLLLRTLEGGGKISPLFSVPWMTNQAVRPDWLHCADQGVCADFTGNFFYYLIENKMAGATRKHRCAALWGWIQDFYNRAAVTDRLQNLLPSMVSKPGAPPKLRSSAAQCRALVPAVAELAELHMGANPVERAMWAAARELRECYAVLSAPPATMAEALATHSRRFAAQYIALESAMRAQGDTISWRVKPKMHVFLELCSQGSQPSLFWTYRDEDFGGACAHLARRRGGLLRAKATSASLLRKFCILQPPPRILGDLGV